jgi:hypothetical protein
MEGFITLFAIPAAALAWSLIYGVLRIIRHSRLPEQFKQEELTQGLRLGHPAPFSLYWKRSILLPAPKRAHPVSSNILNGLYSSFPDTIDGTLFQLFCKYSGLTPKDIIKAVKPMDTLRLERGRHHLEVTFGSKQTLFPGFPYRNVEFYHRSKSFLEMLRSYSDALEALKQLSDPRASALWSLDPSLCLYFYIKAWPADRTPSLIEENAQSWCDRFPEHKYELELLALSKGVKVSLKPTETELKDRRSFCFFPILAAKSIPPETLIFVEDCLLEKSSWKGMSAVIKATSALGETARLFRTDQCWSNPEQLPLAVEHILRYPTPENLTAISSLRKKYGRAQEIFHQHRDFFDQASGQLSTEDLPEEEGGLSEA